MAKYPDCYLHVRESRSGASWVMALRGNSKLDLRHQVTRWVKSQFAGDWVLDGALMPRLKGDYYARIMTDGRPPDSIVCWDGGGFFVKPKGCNV
jgi:hypothetical protein